VVLTDVGVVAVLVIVLALVLSRLNNRNSTARWSGSEWIVEQTTLPDSTIVSLGRRLIGQDRPDSEVVERQEVGTVERADPEHEQHVQELMRTAVERAAQLNKGTAAR
jgi:hypothetical protein